MPTTEQGAAELEALGRRLKAAAPELKKELARGIREGAKPVIPKVRSSALSMLPKRGGLAALVAGSKIGVRTRMTGAQAGVEIKGTGKGRLQISKIDEGSLRHPVFKNHGWVSQSVPAGFFTEPITKDLSHIQASIQRAMAAVANKIEG